MHTRETSDYGSLIPGSREYNAAVVARKEMLKGFANRQVEHSGPRNCWRQQMIRHAEGFDSPYGIQRHAAAEKARQEARKAA